MRKKLTLLSTFLIANLLFVQLSFAASNSPLVARLSQEQGIDQDAAQKQVEAVFNAIKSELKAGNPITIRSFGKFHLQARDARKGRNPRTGETIDIPAKKYPRFTSSDVLKKEMN